MAGAGVTDGWDTLASQPESQKSSQEPRNNDHDVAWAAQLTETSKIEVFGADEEPGSNRAFQQWLMKLEYVCMQTKMASKSTLSEIERIKKAVVNGEKRQDMASGCPEDFLRHWEESDADCRRLMIAKESQRHATAGVCCPCSCLCWLWSLTVAVRCMAKWKKDEEAQQAAAATEKAAEQAKHVADETAAAAAALAAVPNAPAAAKEAVEQAAAAAKEAAAVAAEAAEQAYAALP